MPIQQLPPQLANQIAAGEVVERPASVVKELVENSIDAGATRIEIDIEQGGSKLIRIRDNGCGIAGDELVLALERHATSKIATLDDLQAITSLGFRGEALASISSVSRLTLTSCVQGQQQAWQAYAEGRDMQVTIKPASHPQGTTLEVRNLFYNMPARRKFLRTEKTEFTHIDEVIRRIALARFDITLLLQHNGKTVRQYRAATEDLARERRLTAICGESFTRQALEIDWRHGDLALNGWMSLSASEEMQYCYVNGRVMRDRLINHAIRQACETSAVAVSQPAWALFLCVDPRQVDVNVHPAKHEVRFHQSRLVHDFICQGVSTLLCEHHQQQIHSASPAVQKENRAAAGENSFHLPARLQEPDPGSYRALPAGETAVHAASDRAAVPISDHRWPHAGRHYQQRQETLYRQLMETAPESTPAVAGMSEQTPEAADLSQILSGHKQSFGRVLAIVEQQFALLECDKQICLLSLPVAERYLCEAQLNPEGQTAAESQPLLIPLRLSVSQAEQQHLMPLLPGLASMGIEASLENAHITICALPLPLRQQNLHILIPELIGYLTDHASFDISATASWLASQITREAQQWSIARAITLLAQLEYCRASLLISPPEDMVQAVNLQPLIHALTHG